MAGLLAVRGSWSSNDDACSSKQKDTTSRRRFQVIAYSTYGQHLPQTSVWLYLQLNTSICSSANLTTFSFRLDILLKIIFPVNADVSQDLISTARP